MPQNLAQIEQGQRNDPPGTPVAPYLHGQGGLFNMQGADTRVISAIMSPLAGVASELPVINGEYGTQPNSYGGVDEEASIAITGVTSGALDDIANQPSGDCVDGPEGGLLKAGSYVNMYSRYRGSTREVSIVRSGRLASLCEPLTLALLNSPQGFGGISTPSVQPTLQNAILNELASRLYESLHSFQRMFSKRLWVGSPANNNGEFRDLWGFESQINTGTHIDRTSSAKLTALDPDIKLFGFDMVNGSGRDIVEYIEMADAYTTFNAEQQGLDDYDYWLTMRPSAFREITAVWPIRESFAALRQLKLIGGTSAILNFDSMTITEQRNTLREQRVLPVNGRLRRVILDTSIPEKNVKTASQLKAGQYASDIYGIPRTVQGNLPATFWKYFNHANGQAQALERFAQLGGDMTFTSDNGLFRWYVNFKNGCIKFNYEFGPKLVCIAPQLAWRITNVGYEPLQHEREAYPDSDYFFNGGNTNSVPQKFYTGWSPTTPVQLGS